MNVNWKHPAWTACTALAAIVVSLISLAVSIWAVQESKRQHSENVQIAEEHREEDIAREEDKQTKFKAVLVARKPSYEPMETGVPTVIPLFNEGKEEGLIERVTFRITGESRTPSRPKVVGKGPTIPINFTAQHLNNGKDTFSLSLRRPSPAPGEEWTVIEVAIVNPDSVGHTYTGVLTVHYDGTKELEVPRVEVDVIRKTPISEP